MTLSTALHGDKILLAQQINTYLGFLLKLSARLLTIKGLNCSHYHLVKHLKLFIAASLCCDVLNIFGREVAVPYVASHFLFHINYESDVGGVE